MGCRAPSLVVHAALAGGFAQGCPINENDLRPSTQHPSRHRRSYQWDMCLAQPVMSACLPHHHLPCCRLGQALAHQCAIGFSGVVFGLIVIDNSVSHATSRSIFGLFSVPARVYPWALMVLWQLLLPSVSFLGHLTGIVVSAAAHGADCRGCDGYMPAISRAICPCHFQPETDLALQMGEFWVKGWLKHVTPSLARLEALESRPFLSRLVVQPNYCPCSGVGGSSLASGLPTSFGAGLRPGHGQQQVAQVGRLPQRPGAVNDVMEACLDTLAGLWAHGRTCALSTQSGNASSRMLGA